MWKHQFAAVGILLLCLGAWVGTALYRAHAAESAVRRRLDHMSERTRAGVTTPGLPEPDVRADRRALLLNPFLSKPPVYLYLNGRKVAELHL